jgi:hypothetical protein
MTDTAIYIQQNLGSGYWSVSVADPQDSPFGFYACVIKDYWALLWEFGPFNWAYIILRYK